MIITIDGPAASGKSTIARALAKKLHFYYLCSGLLYRSLSYLLLNVHRYTVQNLDAVTQKDIDYCFDQKRFSYQYDEINGEHIFYDGNDITPYLKDRLIDQVSSIISVNKTMRHAVTQLQHIIASTHDIVTDGRDVGSVVFPQAEYKFFITASVEIRAKRWQKDQEKYGNYFSLQEAIAAITDRDERDKGRLIAPLVVPAGAIVVDTSDLTVEQAIEKIINIVDNG